MDDGIASTTTDAQNDLEEQVYELFAEVGRTLQSLKSHVQENLEESATNYEEVVAEKMKNQSFLDHEFALHKDQHVQYLLGGLGALPSGKSLSCF